MIPVSPMSRNECRIYVGNLPPDIRTKDIQDLFHKFGKVRKRKTGCETPPPLIN